MTLMRELLCALLLFLQLIAVDGIVTLTSNVTVASNSKVCPGGVKFRCIAELERQGTLRWFKSINGQEKQPLASYSFDQNKTLPFLILTSPKVVLFTSSLSMSTTTFNSTLEANLSWFVDMNVSSIECGSFGDFKSQSSSYLITSRPPPPVFMCTLVNNSRSVEFIWDNTYTTLNEIRHYTITNLRSMNVCTFSTNMSSSGVFNLVDGVYNSLNVTPLNYCDQRGEACNVEINLKGLSAPSNVEVTALYNLKSELSGIEVKWQEVDPVIISETCDYNDTLYYKVIVEDSEANVVLSKEIVCDNLCQVTLNTISIFKFNITVIAVNAVGQSRNVVHEISITRVSSLNVTVHFADCYVYVNCTLSLDSISYCEIQYSTGNSSPKNIITGPLNELVRLPLLKPLTTYNLEFSTNVSAMAREKTSRIFTTEEFDPRIPGEHFAMITIGCLLLLVSIISSVAFTVCVFCSSSALGFKYRVVICVVNFSLCMISLLLWISAGFYIGRQTDTCNTQWKNGRIVLISSALISSIISLLFVAASSVWIILTIRFAKSATTELVQTEFEEYASLNHIRPDHVGTKQTRNLSQPETLCADYDVMCHEPGPRISSVPQVEEYSHLQLHQEHQKTNVTDKKHTHHVPLHNEFESEYSHLGDRH